MHPFIYRVRRHLDKGMFYNIYKKWVYMEKCMFPYFLWHVFFIIQSLIKILHGIDSDLMHQNKGYEFISSSHVH